MTETEYISYFLGRLRKFGRQNKVWIGLVAHPTKLKKDDKTRKFPVPTLYDIAGSANFFNKPDNGVALWRDHQDKNNLVQVHIQKIKAKGIGVSGTMQLFQWDRMTGRFTEYTPPPPEQKHYQDPPTGYFPYKD